MTIIHTIASGESCSNPDAAVFALIERCAETWAACERLDVEPSSAIHEAAAARSTELGRLACELEQQIAEAEVRTLEGLLAKIRSIRRAEFDNDQMPAVLESLERDVQRLTPAVAVRCAVR